MTFDQVIAALRRVRPDADVGATARRGKYYRQARNMRFQRFNDQHYFADGPRGARMWLYVSQTFGRICCGNKNY